MSEKDALMQEKNELLKRMLEMQAKFVELEHAGQVSPQEYYVPSAGTYLEQYKEEYHSLAMRVNKLAHAIKESGHIH